MSIIVDCALSAQIQSKGVHKMTELQKLLALIEKLSDEEFKILRTYVEEKYIQQSDESR